ncbi:hypothetical protein Gpo141_00008237 [Globisporangium polare]
MSLALLEEEHSLEAALAFLDSCGEEQLDPPFDVAFDLDALLEEDDLVLDSPTSDPESIGSAAHSSNTASSDNSGRQVVARSKPTRQRATRKCKAVGPAAPRRRTSTDILELREQVIQLTTRIDQLNKRPRAQPIGSGFHSNHITQGARLQARDAQGSSLELGGIVLEREKLREAELLNAKLKVAWRRQLKLCQQLENVFKKGFAPSDVDALFDTTTAPPIHNHTMVRDTSLVFAKLHRDLENLYAQTTAISVSISKRDTTRMWSSSQVHHDSLLGDVFEYMTSTPLHCELDELATQVWRMLNSEAQAKQKPQVVSHDTREHSTESHEHQFTRKLDCQFGSIYVNGVSVIRKFVEQHRVVIAYTSALSLAGTELMFREIGWLILLQTTPEQSASVPNITPPSASLQTCYRMYPDHTSGSAAASRPPDALYFENFVLQSHCEAMRSHQLHLQSDLFDRFGSSVPPGAVHSPQSDPFTGCYN